LKPALTTPPIAPSKPMLAASISWPSEVTTSSDTWVGPLGR
jgi:hypothetical protein